MNKLGVVKVTAIYKHEDDFIRSDLLERFEASVELMLSDKFLDKDKLLKVESYNTRIEFNFKSENLLQVIFDIHLDLITDSSKEAIKESLSEFGVLLELTGMFLGHENLKYNSHLVETEVFYGNTSL